MATRKYYIITETDKEELNRYLGTNTLTDESYSYLQILLMKSKWKVTDLRNLNQMIDDNLGYFLYQLFEIKAKHPLFVKYYSNDERLHPPRGNLEDLRQIAESLRQGLITRDDLPSMGVRVRSYDELIPDHDRKRQNIELKSKTHDKLNKQVSVSNKNNTYKAVR